MVLKRSSREYEKRC